MFIFKIINNHKHIKFQYSPVIELNRLVPYYKLYRAKKGILELEKFEKNPNTLRNVLYFSIKAELYKELGDKETAKIALQVAIELTENEMQKRHLIKKRNRLN